MLDVESMAELSGQNCQDRIVSRTRRRVWPALSPATKPTSVRACVRECCVHVRRGECWMLDVVNVKGRMRQEKMIRLRRKSAD